LSPQLYKTECTSDDRHTGEYIAEKIFEIINEVGYQKIIKKLVTDNATPMERAKKIVV